MKRVISVERENELITLSQNGSTKAFDELMSHYQDYIRNVAKRYVDYESDLEEVVQEVLLKVWLNLSKFRAESKLTTWLFIIALNEAKTNLNNRRRIPSHPHNQEVIYSKTDSEDGEDDPDLIYGIDDQCPDSLFMADELHDQIMELIKELPDDLREALELRELELKTYDEISTETDTLLGTVKSRLHNGRMMLDQKLKRRFDADRNNDRFNFS